MGVTPRAPGADHVARLYDRLGPSLYRYALMLLARPDQAEDVVQQVFLAYLRMDATRIDSVDGYLKRAVRNESFSVLRRRTGGGPNGDADVVPLEPVAPTADPGERLALERALAELPPDQREVVHLKVFEGLTFREIAELAGESINTVASRHRYAIEKLGRLLG